MSPADSPFAQLPVPGLHPATAELRAYAAGTLPSAEQHRIEAHSLDCKRCAELMDGFLMTDATTTDQAVAALRIRLQARLGQAAPTPARPRWAWPRVAAAVALLGVVAGSLWTWNHRAATTPVATARLEAAQPASPATSEPRLEPAALPPPAGPATAVAPAPAVPVATKPPRTADFAVVRPEYSPHRTRLRRPRPAAKVVRPASPTQAAAVTKIVSTSTQAADDTAAAAPKQLAAAAAPPTNAADRVQDTKKAVVDTISVARPLLADSSLNKNPVASNATVHVANTPMPAALAINPAPVKGKGALSDYLRRTAIEFEPKPGFSPLNGTVRVRFIVEADGKLSNLKVVRGLRSDYDSEALRMLCDGPAWRPGVAGGRRAPLPMEVAVSF